MNSPLFQFLTRIQDEVHRFAITFHREKRSKRQIASELDTIKGIGNITKTLLIKTFHSVKRIREASADELAAAIGPAKAKLLMEGLRRQTDDTSTEHPSKSAAKMDAHSR